MTSHFIFLKRDLGYSTRSTRLKHFFPTPHVTKKRGALGTRLATTLYICCSQCAFRISMWISNFECCCSYIVYRAQWPGLSAPTLCQRASVCPGRTSVKSSLARFRTKTFYTPSSWNKRLHNLDEIKTSFQEANLLSSK